MREKIDCFLPCDDLSLAQQTIDQLRNSRTVQNIFLLVNSPLEDVKDARQITVDNLTSSNTLMRMAENAQADYVLIMTKSTSITLGQGALVRMLRVASDSNAAMVYSDRTAHPVIDYFPGSIRDDFDFGCLWLVKTSLLHTFAMQAGEHDYQYAGLYALRLFLSRQGEIFHINECLYTEEETDLRASGVKQFDYVNPRNREVQIEMEHAATAHLAAIGAKIDPGFYRRPDFNEQEFEIEASVVIPVYNREKTIMDAVESALGQKASFKFNVIVVDNHSTDKTTELLNSLHDDRLVHIIPERTDLGIGGCWNMAINDDRCGRFAVQLDSDDLYSSPKTLQQIVDAFYKQNAAMVVGSYRMCDFELNTLPPGLIDHKEWTDENGPNNALRINGLGAPRAFFTPLLRQIQFPNTSYGEDYALGLIFSRHYRIGRIYTELYLCRRWGGNSDAALSVEKVNANNLYKDRLRTLEIQARQQMNQGKQGIMTDSPLQRFFNRQLEKWEAARQRYHDLRGSKTRELVVGSSSIQVQWNPARMVSTGAKMDKKTIAERPCFLCEQNRPKEQIKKDIDGQYELLVNPFPILPQHFTIPSLKHQPQRILNSYGEIHKLLEEYPEMMVFYNGPQCGASAPDHAHFQAGTCGVLPLQMSWKRLSSNLTKIVSINDHEDISLIEDYHCTALLIRSRSQYGDEQLFRRLYDALPDMDPEPMMNIVAWRRDEDFLSVVFPRTKHRPECYYAEGDEQYIISPGALDMAGLIITPRQEDFDRLTPEKALSILNEITLSGDALQQVLDILKSSSGSKLSTLHSPLSTQKEPNVSVGIVSAEKIAFTLNASYTAKGETLTGNQEVEFCEGGILWRGNQYRELTFTPQSDEASFSLHDVTIGVNFHWERKETQVFSGTLRLVVEADKIVAINELPVERYLTSVISSEMSATASKEFLKAHAVISRSWLLAQMEKRKQLDNGGGAFFSFIKKDDELIRWYDREDHTIFDVCADDHCQRYQGITKQSSPAVEQAISETRGQILAYGDEICDARFSKCCGGETEEFQYCWEDTPKPYLVSFHDPYCNTNDKNILAQVLNDYDQETIDFYRWTVEYTQEELSELINRKLKDDFGTITDLIPVERGKSGRIWKLKIVGTKKTFSIGKELEIRRALSETHLLSSAFDVEKQGDRFILHGKGWGHGVGMCQIGAAVMGEQGKTYDEILLFYYRNAEIQKLYE
jgi:SpoIID/LytB domain protein